MILMEVVVVVPRYWYYLRIGIGLRLDMIVVVMAVVVVVPLYWYNVLCIGICLKLDTMLSVVVVVMVVVLLYWYCVLVLV